MTLMLRTFVGFLAVFPGLVLAHSGDNQSASMFAAFLHPFTGVDHVLASALIVLLTLKRHGTVAWLPGALFGSAIALGFLIALLGLQFAYAGYLAWALMAVMALSFLKPSCVLPMVCLGTVGALGLSIGHAHALLVQVPDPTQCLCGIALAAGSLVVAGILSVPLLFAYRKYAALRPQTCQ